MDPVRCPYCAEGANFREMMPLSDGGFACRTCGHRVLSPGFPFGCECLKCVELRRFAAKAREGSSVAYHPPAVNEPWHFVVGK